MTLLDAIKSYRPVAYWQEGVFRPIPHLDACIEAAEARLERFRPFFSALDSQCKDLGGYVESPLVALDHLATTMGIGPESFPQPDANLGPRLLLKCDHALPISGSIKARGGFHEVLAHAEALALEAGLIDKDLDYSQFLSQAFKAYFKGYKIIVGSTGNLGLSIGLMGQRLGFSVIVHMSKDAKPWKVDKLRANGVRVVLHQGDYGQAVSTARAVAAADSRAYFVDDEASVDLFCGYAIGGRRLANQLREMGLQIGPQRPLYVYLPCGVGGGPGGVIYGLKQVFGDLVHPIFAEPTHAPCFLLAMVEGHGKPVPIQGFGLDNITEADGLAVGCASPLALDAIGSCLEGLVTVEDMQIHKDLALLADLEGICIEPSAAAGFEALRRRLKAGTVPEGVHLVWSTGGSLVPKAVWHEAYLKGK